MFALLFGCLHAVFALTELVPNGTSGESAAMGFLIYDAPLHWAVNHFNWGAPFRFDTGRYYVVFFSTVGTLMHAAVGFLFGLLGSALVRALRAASDHSWSGR